MKKLNLIASIINFIDIFVITALIMFLLDDSVPTHFGIDGKADAYAGKWSYFWLSLIPIALNLFFVLYRRFYKKRKQNNIKVEDTVIPTISLVFGAIVWVFILLALSGQTTMGYFASFIIVLLGIMLMLVSNYLGKTSSNKTFGLKLPWTINNDKVWNKTHRFAGVIGFIGSIAVVLIGLISLFFANTVIYLSAFAVVILSTVLIPTIYSYIIYKKEV